MLASGKLVGFVPTKDYDKARGFYVDKLGFDFVSLDQFALVVSIGGHKIRIAKVANFTPLQGTILGWEVEDIEQVVRWLADRGVATEKYPFVQDQGTRHLVDPQRRQGSLVQRSRRQRPLRKPAPEVRRRSRAHTSN